MLSSSDMSRSESYAGDTNGLANNSGIISDGENALTIQGSQLLGNNSLDRRLNRLAELCWEALQRVSLALSSMHHGAHTLPRHGNGASEHLDRYTNIIKWFLRLHLALFYWNGMYPTFAHRLAGAKLSDGVAPHSPHVLHPPTNDAIVANRPTYKPIAGLILLQAMASLGQATTEASIELAHYIQVSFFRWRRRRRQQFQQQSSRRFDQNETNNQQLQLSGVNSEREEYMGLIEERVPGINSSKCFRNKSTRSKKNRDANAGREATQPCGICLNERTNPAAPSACGHVFCWNCILHWVSNVRAECPLCRAQTRPQDVLPLYNYP